MSFVSCFDMPAASSRAKPNGTNVSWKFGHLAFHVVDRPADLDREFLGKPVSAFRLLFEHSVEHRTHFLGVATELDRGDAETKQTSAGNGG